MAYRAGGAGRCPVAAVSLYGPLKPRVGAHRVCLRCLLNWHGSPEIFLEPGRVAEGVGHAGAVQVQSGGQRCPAEPRLIRAALPGSVRCEHCFGGYTKFAGTLGGAEGVRRNPAGAFAAGRLEARVLGPFAVCGANSPQREPGFVVGSPEVLKTARLPTKTLGAARRQHGFSSSSW